MGFYYNLQLKKFSIQESFSTVETTDKIHKKLFQPICENEAWYTIARIVGLICGWPVAEYFGRYLRYILKYTFLNYFNKCISNFKFRNKGLIFSNVFRFIPIMMQISLKIHAQTYLNNIANQTYINDLNSTIITDPENTGKEASIMTILMTSKIIDAFYSGLSYFLGLLYVYEISPKLSTKIGSLPVMAFYLLLKSSFDYFASFFVVFFDPVKSSVKLTIYLGLYIIFTGLMQMAFLTKVCPESPSYLVVQMRNKEKAKKGKL